MALLMSFCLPHNNIIFMFEPNAPSVLMQIAVR